ncbi:hypothetical protein JCM10908_006363 [Rhodotorula pacifica]|uniref:uncharacterized protein n=1 Tax=Rhodotorula pacifica TaxID=1495444 RepID=UPI00317F8C50
MARLRGGQQDTAGDDFAAQVAAGMNIGEGAEGDQPMARPGPGTLKVQLVVADQEGIKPTRKIRSIEAFAANDTSRAFEVNGQMMAIEQFFQNHYNAQLCRPDSSCISVSKIALWPLELCHVETGQKWSKKLNPAQTADAIRLTTVEPRGRVGMLSEGLKRIQPSVPALGQWEYMRGIRPREGVWDVKGQHFHTTTRINRMLVIVFNLSQFFSVTDAQTCMAGLITTCTRLSIQIADRQPAIHNWPNGANIPSFIHKLSKDLIQRTGIPPKLIVCFLPRKPCNTHREIKRFGDQSVGVATQCMFENKAKNGGEP